MKLHSGRGDCELEEVEGDDEEEKREGEGKG
jgi:hypothetical protein